MPDMSRTLKIWLTPAPRLNRSGKNATNPEAYPRTGPSGRTNFRPTGDCRGGANISEEEEAEVKSDLVSGVAAFQDSVEKVIYLSCGRDQITRAQKDQPQPNSEN